MIGDDEINACVAHIRRHVQHGLAPSVQWYEATCGTAGVRSLGYMRRHYGLTYVDMVLRAGAEPRGGLQRSIAARRPRPASAASACPMRWRIRSSRKSAIAPAGATRTAAPGSARPTAGTVPRCQCAASVKSHSPAELPTATPSQSAGSTILSDRKDTMITYDRGIRTLLHSTLRQFCGRAGEAARRAGGDAQTQPRDQAALARLGAVSRRRNIQASGRKRRLACVAGIAIVLGALIAPSTPAAAQDGANPPISAATASTLYLPAMARNWHAWFDDAELDEAIRRAGYDPATADQHIVCTLDPSAVPPYLIRYGSCEQYLIGTTPTEGTGHYIWYVRLGDGFVHGLEVGS